MMKREFWIRLGVALLIVLLLWWLYMAILVDEDEALALVECGVSLDIHCLRV
ncbi:MAG: hypothetical protein IKJ42_04855 [Bacteroidaceae bacterium]|nr:hypothetical protein [Bacteroidaceae bacterium]MBR3896336.1 hypothetical protein [Bacteroidaceae bacterium]